MHRHPKEKSYYMMVSYFLSIGVPENPLSHEKFHELLSLFLFSRTGGRYVYQFEFNGTLRCNESAPPIIVSVDGASVTGFFINDEAKIGFLLLVGDVLRLRTQTYGWSI